MGSHIAYCDTQHCDTYSTFSIRLHKYTVAYVPIGCWLLPVVVSLLALAIVSSARLNNKHSGPFNSKPFFVTSLALVVFQHMVTESDGFTCWGLPYCVLARYTEQHVFVLMSVRKTWD